MELSEQVTSAVSHVALDEEDKPSINPLLGINVNDHEIFKADDDNDYQKGALSLTPAAS